jgi:predicted DNA-binding protein YlxM (UPF0122 family)
MDSDTLFNTMLFDFFGELLTEKQREYYDLYYNEDLSLSEIAESVGISKQGVYDIVKRAEKTLIDTETKTGIINKWMQARTELEITVNNNENLHPTVLRYFQLKQESINGV